MNLDTSNRPTEEQMFAAIQLAGADVLFFNWSWWDKGDRHRLVPILLCNDTFGYACADGEQVEWEEVPRLRDLYRDAPNEDEANKRMVRFIADRRGTNPLPQVQEWLNSPPEEGVEP